MVHLLSWRRWESGWTLPGLLAGLASLMVVIDPAAALGQPPAKESQPSARAEQEPGKNAADHQDAAPAPDTAPVADPIQTRRAAPTEVFKDENVEAILDLAKLRPQPGPPVDPNDVLRVKEMAANPNLPADRVLIDKVVRGLAAQLTNKDSIQSMLEEPAAEEDKDKDQDQDKEQAAKKKAAVVKSAPKGDAGHAIQVATSNLLDPIFLAQGAKNDAFLREYRRSLQAGLTPLLKNHLIPRVQAMIVLGEAANPAPEGLVLFQNEIASRTQALWVKLWALEGICNIKKAGGRFTTDQETRAALVIANFLKQKELPWPIQMRGLQALGWLRQGTMPTDREKAPMANVVMSYLADPEARLEVRAEAARGLGLLQTNAIPKYNYKLVAAAAGRLIADLAAAINDLYSDSPPHAENPTRARYLAALLVGPAYQCFSGVDGQTGSGLLRSAAGNSDSLKYSQKVFGTVKPIAQAAVDLLGAPSKEYKKRKQDLAARVAGLRSLLEDEPPESPRLVPGGPAFGAANQTAGAFFQPPAQPVAQVRRAK